MLKPLRKYNADQIFQKLEDLLDNCATYKPEASLYDSKNLTLLIDINFFTHNNTHEVKELFFQDSKTVKQALQKYARNTVAYEKSRLPSYLNTIVTNSICIYFDKPLNILIENSISNCSDAIFVEFND